MSRFHLPVLAVLLLAAVGWSQTLDEQELRSVRDRTITFESYTGPHAVFDTADEIVGIGRALAVSRAARETRGDYYGLYSVIRAVDPTERQKLDADLIVFEEKAGVDHIDNVRRIISGYLQGAFAVSRADAELLAVFTTYYNAVYRGLIDELRGKYSAVVMANLSARNAGIAVSYRDWPGRTRLIIPLNPKGPLGGSEAAGSPVGPVSTGELSEKKVIEQLRSEPDKGLPERKALVDLKEREVEKAKEAIVAEEKKLEERKAEVARREETLPKGPEKPAPPVPSPAAKATTPTPPQTPPPAAPAPAQPPAAAAPAPPPAPPSAPAPAAPTVVEEKARIAEAEKVIEAKKEAVAAKETEIARDRQGIVADERGTPAGAPRPAETARPSVAESLLYLTGRGRPAGGRLVVIDPATRTASVSSPVGAVVGLDFSYYQDRVLVLAREGEAVHLLLLDPKTLEVASHGQDVISPLGYVHSQEGAIYAVTIQGSGARVAKYDQSLSRTALSTEAVDPNTYIRIFGDEVYVSSPDGRILVLAAGDLSRTGEVQVR